MSEADYVGSVCLLNSKRREILIDAADIDLIGNGKWYVTTIYGTSYASKDINAVRWSLHRLIMGAEKGQIVDHVNRNGLDNRRSNLRFCTASQNIGNQKLRKDCNSGFRGVYFEGDKQRQKPWRARISFGRTRRSLGLFSSPEAAHTAYQRAARELFGEFVRS